MGTGNEDLSKYICYIVFVLDLQYKVICKQKR